jgi:hypothetical protein
MGQAWQALRLWSARRWRAAALSAVVIALIMAVPTAIIPTPIFGRSVEVTWWSYPVVVLTAVLGGLLFATYVREPGDGGQREEPTSKLAIAGGVLSYLAVGCPVCNKLVLLALGASGAMTWFAPVQGYLAIVAIGLMVGALIIRLRGEVACPVSGPGVEQPVSTR